MIKVIKKEYARRKSDIRKRLKDFKKVWSQSDKRVFSELCFCICTPQSKAVFCDKAVSSLEVSGKLFNGDIRQVRAGLKAVRFPNNKAGYIVDARKKLIVGGKIRIKHRIVPDDARGTRDWLVKNIKGIGYKEASHFLRNIGFGEELAILDVHILKNMKRYDIVKEIPKSITKRCYFELEKDLEKFSSKMKIPMGELDLLFWSMETGQIFK